MRIQNAIRDGLIEQGIAAQMATLDQMLTKPSPSGKSAIDSPPSSGLSPVPTVSAS
jgi:hypothetical protein